MVYLAGRNTRYDQQNLLFSLHGPYTEQAQAISLKVWYKSSKDHNNFKCMQKIYIRKTYKKNFKNLFFGRQSNFNSMEIKDL